MAPAGLVAAHVADCSPGLRKVLKREWEVEVPGMSPAIAMLCPATPGGAASTIRFAFGKIAILGHSTQRPTRIPPCPQGCAMLCPATPGDGCLEGWMFLRKLKKPR